MYQDDIIERKYYPFLKYQIKVIQPKRRAIKVEYVKKNSKTRYFKKDHSLFHFEIIFYYPTWLWGMSFIDMAFLSKGKHCRWAH